MANIWKDTENVLDANVTAYILKYLKYPKTFLPSLQHALQRAVSRNTNHPPPLDQLNADT